MMPEYERLSGNTWDSLTTPEDYHKEVQQLRAENEELIFYLKMVTGELKTIAELYLGECDHEAGICYCGIRHLISDSDETLQRIKGKENNNDSSRN